MPARRGLALAAVSALPLALLAPTLPASTAAPAAGAPAAAAAGPWFERAATYPVFQNVPAGVDPVEETVAEISDVTEDGRTVVYTDAAGKRIGFVDITDPAQPVGKGSLDLSELGDADDQPTSVAVVGDHVLVVVDTSASFTEPSGRLDVVRISDLTTVASLDLGGQPDSIAISPDQGFAAIAMENQRDEEATPTGGEEGDLPQLPAGFVQVVELDGAPETWIAEPVALVGDDGAALPALAGMNTPEDPEPEYVDINADNQLVVTLQENNGLVVIDLPSRSIRHAFSAGNAKVEGVDVDDDGIFDFTGSLDVPREPDAVQWVGDGLVATANEGDWLGGSRGWTVFDAATGEVVWDAGRSFEDLAVAHGLFNNDRADNKGAEPEGLAFAEMRGTPYAFVGSERSNFVAVYDMTDPRKPVFRQVLPTTNGPEGLLPVPERDLLVVSSEEDDASAGVRATVGVYQLGDAKPRFPSIVSVPAPGEPAGATPIGWGALGALSGVPGSPRRLYAASDAAYATGRIYSVDASASPAVIDDVLEVSTPSGEKPAIDIEGLAARRQGGFWLAVEGATGAENALVRTDAAGVVRQRVALPADVVAGLGKWGLEGVTIRRGKGGEQVFVALQRPVAGESTARIGRYDVRRGTWTWYGYPLETTEVAGDWIGLSELTFVDRDTLAVIERDKLNGPSAAVKRIYTIDVPGRTSGEVTPLRKRLAVDLLPAMQDQRGWTQEKLEGLGITGAGRVFAVTDNDGVSDATGEIQLYSLGTVRSTFGRSVATRTRLSASRERGRRGQRVRLTAVVGPGTDQGRVVFTRGGRTVGTVPVADGRARLTVRLTRTGVERFRATYRGGAHAASSRSGWVRVAVTR
ncbi:esterase-like activity of phytase family protein [Nocardioides deserti]|uniref:Esterase-like activity of phytase family protein n=1 Tax=Nocardioides deserti TaxID=1588644 RepID=A0ABR6U9W7_9ACTN|nr:esterase-like activity of phytase family protein [Nocardioides deserti]MBC2961237.1 esterase-like activity of phytase family protein [Nocardioides deserti]GGO72152.1 hypothetical protein GCM10012276_14820 [Nocardioides deserti]